MVISLAKLAYVSSPSQGTADAIRVCIEQLLSILTDKPNAISRQLSAEDLLRLGELAHMMALPRDLDAPAGLG
jgi:hypothetical protein